MLVPWRVVSEHDRELIVAALDQFNGIVLWPPQERSASTLEGARKLDPRFREEVVERLEVTETDPASHFWIATGQIGRTWVQSLLHASLDGEGLASVDLLLAIDERNRSEARAYDGFGELLLLVMLLKQSGVRRLHIPFEVDPEWSGLAGQGWMPDGAGTYRVHSN